MRSTVVYGDPATEYTPEPKSLDFDAGMLVDSDFDRQVAVWLVSDICAGDPRIEFEIWTESDVLEWETGNVYGWVVSNYSTGETIDSCWGFYGYDYARACAVEAMTEGGY